MRKIFIIAMLLGILTACENVPVGYLITDNAEFDPDFMTIDLDLDLREPYIDEVPNPEYEMYIGWGFTHDQLVSWGIMPTIEKEVAGEHYYRSIQKIPWVSYPLQGVDGTRPLFYRVIGATKVGGGDVTELLSKCSMRGDGAVEIEFENNITAGEYLLDIEVSNEGYAHELPNMLRVIVE
ncbi:hypothetical protein [Marinifilum breve]|nr:hypothetical protein [Marinifilum breve]